MFNVDFHNKFLKFWIILFFLFFFMWEGVSSSPTPRCSSYWKGSLQVALSYSHQLYLLTYYTFFIVSYVFSLFTSACDIYQHYKVNVRNNFDILQKTSERLTSNEKYENFITTHLEATAEWLSTKPRVKCWVPLESKAVR